MNYFSLIEEIKNTSLGIVEEFYEGDVYEYLNSGNHKYPSVILTTQNVATNDGINTIGATLFCVDRLTDDSANKLEIQSDTFDRLQHIISTLEEKTTNLESNTYTPFTEKFADLCAGMFVEFSLQYVGEGECDDDLTRYKEIELTKNGIYDVIGYDRAIVNVSPYDSLKIKLTEPDVVPLIRFTSDTSISSKVIEISDNTTGWTYTLPYVYNDSKGVFNTGGLNNFPNVESVTLGCSRITARLMLLGSKYQVFRLTKLKNLNLPNLESITITGQYPDYLHIFNEMPLEQVNLPNLKTNKSILFQSCTLPEELNLPNLTNCGTGILRSCTGVKKLIVENLTSCPGYSYHPNFVSGCPDLEYIYAPNLSNLSTYGASNGANTLQNCKNLKELVIHNIPFTDSRTPRRYYLRNCPKVEILDLRGSITKSLYLDNYKPSTVIEENLQLFLDNFKTYITDRLPDRSRTTSLSLILSPLVYDTLQESGQTIINLISDKNWTLVKSSLAEI